MIRYCNYSGVGLIPWSPVAMGALSRPLNQRDTLREKTDAGFARMVRNTEVEADREIINRLEKVASKNGHSMAQTAIAWCLSKKNVCPIVGMNKKERMDEAVEACHIKL